MRLLDKVALVTGASRGIGKAVALQFAREGAHLAINAAHDASEAQAVAQAIGELGRQALVVMADVSQRPQVDDMVRQALDRFGRIDILVNNAGIINPTRLEEITESQWDRVISVHLKGTFNCTQAVIPVMKRQAGGKIINVTSPSALRASSRGVADYASAKGGIIAFTRTAAIELARYRINVNCICPAARTRMIDSLMAFTKTPPQEFNKAFPLGWQAEPEEIAPAFVFFASKDADYITGQVLAVDGGLTM